MNLLQMPSGFATVMGGAHKDLRDDKVVTETHGFADTLLSGAGEDFSASEDLA